jgi:hypothetical protein
MTGRVSSVSVSRQRSLIWPGVSPGDAHFYTRLEHWPLNEDTPSHLTEFGDVGFGKTTDNWTAPAPEPQPQPQPQPGFYKQLAIRNQKDVYAKILSGPANQPLTDADYDAMVSDIGAVSRWKEARNRYAVSGLQKDYDEMIRWVRPDVEGYDSEDGLAEPGRSTDGRMEDRKHRRGLGRYWHR